MLIHIRAALVELLSSHPYEYVIAGTQRDYRTYLWSTGKYDKDDASYLDREELLYGLRHARIVLAGDRWTISPAYQKEILMAMSRDNIIVECGLGGNVRRYLYAED
jgi:hypothetical protein